jgi:hypothetical protein
MSTTAGTDRHVWSARVHAIPRHGKAPTPGPVRTGPCVGGCSGREIGADVEPPREDAVETRHPAGVQGEVARGRLLSLQVLRHGSGARDAPARAVRPSRRACRPPGRWRERVDGATRRGRATSATVRAGSARIARAAVNSRAVSAGGRPPVRPRVRAASSPAWVRSRMMARSHVARLAKLWNARRSPAAVVSMASVREWNAISRRQALHRRDELGERARQPVELLNHQRIPRSQVIEGGLPLRAIALGARSPLDTHPSPRPDILGLCHSR